MVEVRVPQSSTQTSIRSWTTDRVLLYLPSLSRISVYRIVQIILSPITRADPVHLIVYSMLYSRNDSYVLAWHPY